MVRIEDTHKCELCGEDIPNGLVAWGNHMEVCPGRHVVVVKALEKKDLEAMFKLFEKSRKDADQ